MIQGAATHRARPPPGGRCHRVHVRTGRGPLTGERRGAMSDSGQTNRPSCEYCGRHHHQDIEGLRQCRVTLAEQRGVLRAALTRIARAGTSEIARRALIETE